MLDLLREHVSNFSKNFIMKNRIGIVGGGQLARMLIPPAKQLGFIVTVLDPTPNSPAGQIADKQIIADLDDEQAMQQLAATSDFLTLEWELANPHLLEKIAQSGIQVNPSTKTLEIIKDKYQQKVFLKKANIPVADFLPVTTSNDIQKAGEKFGYPLLLKTRLGAYDGRGNYVVKNKKNIVKGIDALKGKTLYVERYIPFEKELAIIVARNTKGNIQTFPLVETIHKHNILHTVLAPAPVQKTIAKKAELLARKVMQHLKGAGVFGIEMFLRKDGKVLINEIAPRVHNSGHVTIEHCVTSQFAQHIRAITGLPLGDTATLTPAAIMINILGDKDEKAEVKGLEKALHIPGVSVHIYGKSQTKQQRKMGHITVLGTTLNECLRKAKKARKVITI